MSDAVYEFKVWADGEARDADGRLLDADGNPIEADVNPIEADVAEEDEEPEEAP